MAQPSAHLSALPVCLDSADEKINKEITLQEHFMNGGNHLAPETQLKTLLERKAARTKVISAKKDARSTRQNDVKSSLASLMGDQSGEDFGEDAAHDKRKPSRQLQRVQSTRLKPRRDPMLLARNNSLMHVLDNMSTGVHGRSRELGRSGQSLASPRSVTADHTKHRRRANRRRSIGDDVVSPQQKNKKTSKSTASEKRRHHTSKDIVIPQELPLSKEEKHIVTPASPPYAEDSKEEEKNLSLSGHFREKVQTTGMRNSEEQSENSSVPSLKPTFLQFDPSNPDNLATVNQNEAKVTSTTIRQADGSKWKFQIRKFDGLPAFDPDDVPDVPQSTKSLPVPQDTHGNDMNDSMSSMPEEKTKPKSKTEKEGKKRGMFGMNMHLKFQMNRTNASPDGHVLLEDDSDED
jgi:hypothetical protein